MFPLKDDIPTERFPVVTIVLIAINVAAYLLAIRHGGSLWSGPTASVNFEYGAIPYEITHPGQQCVLAAGGCGPGIPGAAALPAMPETLLTSMFMHGGLLHIAGNMLFLWIFGNNVEDAMGPVRFLAFYLVGGLAALALQTVVDPSSTVPTVGASGAIAAVLGGYLLLYPRARVYTFIFIIILPIPAMLFLVFWFLEQAYFGAGGLTDPAGDGGGVAYFAHIGGFVFGLLAVRLLAQRVRSVPPRYPVY